MADNLGDLVVKIGANIDGFSEAVEGIPEKFTAMLGEINPAIAAVVTAIVGIGGAAVSAAVEYEEAFNTIIAKTGATGTELDGLKESFEKVFTSVPGSAQDVASAIGIISDRLHLTGDDLTAFTEQVGKLSEFSGEKLPSLADAVTKAFQNWGVATEDQKAKLDLLNTIAQQTGTGVTELANSMASIGNLARLSGESFEQTAEQIGTLSSKGVEAQDMFAAISRGMAQAQKSGEDLGNVTLPNLVYSIEQGIKSGNGLNVAMDEFGAKAGPKMYELVKDGIISSADLMKTSLNNAADSINKTYAATDTLGRQFTMLGHNLMDFIEPLGNWIVGGAKDFLGWLNTAVVGVESIYYAMTGQTDALKKLTSTYDAAHPTFQAYADSQTTQKAATNEMANSVSSLGITIVGYGKTLVDVAAQEAARKDNTVLLKQAVTDLKDADGQHAADLKALYVPALTDVATAEENVAEARAAAIVADANLVDAENALKAARASGSNPAIKAAEEALTAAKQDAKDKNEALSESEKTLATSKQDDAAITALLKAAESAIADAIRTDHIPATMSLAEAEGNLVTAKEATLVAIQNEQSAVKALSDFQHQIGEKDAATEKTLKDNLNTATVNLTGARANEAQAIKDVNVIKQASNALDQDILTNTKLLDSYLKDNLIGTNKDLVASMKDIADAKQKQLDSWSALQSALQQENDLKAAGKVNTDQYRDAILAAQQAADAYRLSTDAVNATEEQAARNYGLSKDAIIVLTSSMGGAAVTAATLQAAYNTLGIQTKESLQAAADAADAAFKDIQDYGEKSSTILRDAQIADIKAHIAAEVAAGEEIPAAQQIQLATLEQQEKDYISNSVTRWKDLYNTINGEVASAFKSLIGSLFDNSANDSLDKQGASLQAQLDKQTQAYSDHVATVSAKLAMIPDAYNAALGKLQKDTGATLDKLKASFDDYVKKTNASYDLTTKHNQEALDQQLADLVQNLQDRAEANQRSIEDIATKRKHDEEDAARALDNAALDYKHYVEDQQLKLQQLEGDNSASAKKQREDIQLNLQQRAEDYAALQDKIKDGLTRQEDDLNTSLARQQEDYEKQKADIIAKQAAVVTSFQEKQDELKAALDQSLADKQAAYDKDKADTVASMQAQTDSITANYQSQTAALQSELDKAKADYEAYKTNVTKQLSDLADAHQGPLDRIGSMFTSLFEKIGTSIIESFIKPATDAIGNFIAGALTDLLGGKGFGGVFDSITKLGGMFTGGGGILGTGGGLAGSIPTSTRNGGIGGISSIPGIGGGGGGGAGSTAGSVAGSAVSGVTGILTSVFSGISAVTGILSLFGVGQGGQKDRLNNIDNATTYVAWVFGEGGGHDALLKSEEDLHALVYDSFGGWFRTSLDWVSDRITDTETWTRTSKDLLTNIDATLTSSLASLKSIDNSGSSSSSLSSASSIVINVGGSVIGIQDIIDTLSQKFGAALNLQGTPA